MWSFETEPEFQAELDWISAFVREEIEPLDDLPASHWNIHAADFEERVRPLQRRVKARGLWACHLGSELGGKGYGQLKLALMNEQFGRARFGPIIFGVQAPDSGNAEILAHYGTPEQKARFLDPLLANDIVSCFAITEPQGGADPLMIRMTARADGGEWVLDGEKWFATNARYAAFYIVMAVTDPDATNHRQMSMFIVPADAPGLLIERNYGIYGEPEDDHAHVRFTGVRVPGDSMLGERGEGFVVAQVRLAGGRLHHAMRTVALATRAFEMMCERTLARFTKGERLSEKQLVQEKIADSWLELRQFRLLVLETAWLADRHKDWQAVRQNVAAVKAAMPKLLHDIVSRALHIHGALGLSHAMPFTDWLMTAYLVGLADGPTEVHKLTVAREALKAFQPALDPFPRGLRAA